MIQEFRGYKRLLLGIVFLLYVVFVWQIVESRGLFEYIGIDYRGFRASAEIAHTFGFAEVYDLAKQEEFQAPYYDAFTKGTDRIIYKTVPTPYLAVFILPFYSLLLFSPINGFLMWNLLSTAILILYVFRFMKAIGYKNFGTFILAILLSLPALLNLQFGQVNVWLVICLGEMMLAFLSEKEFTGGLWLGGFFT